MAGEIVHDDHISFGQGRGQLGLNIGFEDMPVHWRINYPGSNQAITPQPCDERLSFPVAERGLGFQPLIFRTPSAQAGHFCVGPGFVNEYQPVGFKPHSGLAFVDPDCPSLPDVHTVLFAGQQRFF